MAKQIWISDDLADAQWTGPGANGLIAGGTLNYYSDNGRTTLLLSVDLHATAPFADTATDRQYEMVRDTGVFTDYAPIISATGTPVAWDIKAAGGTAHIAGTVGASGSDNSMEFANLTWVATEALPVPWSSEPTITQPVPTLPS